MTLIANFTWIDFEMVAHSSNVVYKYLIVDIAYVSVFINLFILGLYVFIDFLLFRNTVFECMDCLSFFYRQILYQRFCNWYPKISIHQTLKKDTFLLSIVSAKLIPRPCANLKGQKCGIKKGSVNVFKLEEKLLTQ